MRSLLEQDPVLDMQVLLSSLRVVNSQGETLFPTLLEQFRTSSLQVMAQLGDGIERSDSRAVAHTLYVFKGSCQLMGAPRLERLTESLRQECLQGMMPANDRWNHLVHTFDEFVDTVQRFQIVYYCRA